MSAAKDEHSDTVWQGYVSAIACLAQAMVLLLAVIAIALSQVGKMIDVNNNANQLKHPNQPKDNAAASSETKSQDTSESVSTLLAAPEATKIASQRGRDNSNQEHKDKPINEGTILNVMFMGDSTRMHAENVNQLQATLNNYLPKKDARWQLVAEVPGDDRELIRRAYLRIFAVRDAMQKAGIPLRMIDVVIVDGGGTDLLKEMPVSINLLSAPLDEVGSLNEER